MHQQLYLVLKTKPRQKCAEACAIAAGNDVHASAAAHSHELFPFLESINGNLFQFSGQFVKLRNWFPFPFIEQLRRQVTIVWIIDLVVLGEQKRTSVRHEGWIENNVALGQKTHQTLHLLRLRFELLPKERLTFGERQKVDLVSFLDRQHLSTSHANVLKTLHTEFHSMRHRQGARYMPDDGEITGVSSANDLFQFRFFYAVVDLNAVNALVG